MNERLRRTGRTTRMFAEAERLAKLGHAVYVVVGDALYAKARGRFAHTPGVSVEHWSFIDVGRFDTGTMRGPGMHPNCRVLIDHAVLEQRYADALREIHRFDPNRWEVAMAELRRDGLATPDAQPCPKCGHELGLHMDLNRVVSGTDDTKRPNIACQACSDPKDEPDYTPGVTLLCCCRGP